MERLFKVIIVIGFILFVCSCTYESSNDTISERYTEEVNESKDKNEKEPISKKTYKTCSEDYNELIKGIVDEMSKEDKLFSRWHLKNYYPYKIIRLYPSKMINSKDFDKAVIDISNDIYNKLAENNYSSKCGLKSSYEYINIEFYNFDRKQDNSPSYQTFKQINVLEISKYNSFEEYDNRGDS